ncbi:hypothetical protein J6590_027500, partial [Homalodisca vitripennis]
RERRLLEDLIYTKEELVKGRRHRDTFKPKKEGACEQRQERDKYAVLLVKQI